MEVCRLDRYSFPVSGIALAPGLVTLDKPWWLGVNTTTQWLELVSTEALAQAPAAWRKREVVLRPEAIVGLEDAADGEAKAQALAEAINEAADDGVATETGTDEDILGVDALAGEEEQERRRREARSTHFTFPRHDLAEHADTFPRTLGGRAPALEVVNMHESSSGSSSSGSGNNSESGSGSNTAPGGALLRGKAAGYPRRGAACWTEQYDNPHFFRTLPLGSA